MFYKEECTNFDGFITYRNWDLPWIDLIDDMSTL